MSENTIKIGFLTISDRASRGVYEDTSGPAMQDWISKAVTSPYEEVSRIIEDEQLLIEKTLIEMSDNLGCNLILTTGGTGPTTRDVTPEATQSVVKESLTVC
jgi:molybdopterin adenylyltransferase